MDDDAILVARPVKEVGKLEGMLGGKRYRVSEEPGSVTAVVVGNRATLLKKLEEPCVPARHADDAWAVSLRGGSLLVEMVVPDLISADGWVGDATISFQVGIPPDDVDREQLAAAWARPGMQSFTVEGVRERISVCVGGWLRYKVLQTEGEEVGKAALTLAEEMAAGADGPLLPRLESMGLTLTGKLGIDLTVTRPAAVDEEAFSKIRRMAIEEVGEESDASRVIYLLTTMKSSNREKLNIWVSPDTPKGRNAQKTRGLGLRKEAGEKDAGGFRRGQDIFIDVMSSTEGYLHLIGIDTAGTVSLLFPNELCNDNFIRPGERFTIPDHTPEMSDGGKFYVLEDTRPGIERIKAIVTREETELLPPVGGQQDLRYRQKAGDALPNVVVLVEKLRGMDTSGWVDAFCQYRVLE